MYLRSVIVLLFISLSPSISLAQELATAPAIVKAEDEVLIVRNYQDHRFWKSLPTEGKVRAPAYPKELLRSGVSGCVAIGFYIEPDGRTAKFRVLESTIGDPLSRKFGKWDKRAATSMFENAAVAYLSRLRFVPGPENTGRQRGFASLPVSFSVNVNPSRSSCHIPDLEVFLSQKMAQTPSQ